MPDTVDEKPPPPPKRSAPENLRNRGLWMWLVFAAVLLLWVGRDTLATAPTISYSEFKAHLARGELKEILIHENEIVGSLATVEQDGESAEAEDETSTAPATFRVQRVEDPDLVKELEAAGVPYSGAAEDELTAFFLTWLLPLGVMLLVFGWLFRSAAKRATGGMMGFGKSRARLVPEKGTGVSFADVAGCDEAKSELGQMVEFLKNPGRFTGLGGRIPKGVLLLGPPGTGKTLLARAVAGEAGVPFFSLTGSDFVEMFVGVGAARVRDLFEQAKAKAPCIVFIDEIDAIGRQRGVSMGVVNDEREQTLNQLLSEMDGFEINSGVILLAATNRPEILDKALLRPGRFDRQVVLDAPDIAGREAILGVHARGKRLAPDVDLARIARVTPGMSGADLANAMNEAALLAAEARHPEITQRDLEDAVERVVAGPERRSRRLEPEEKRRVAYHESGHALVAARSERGFPVEKITIVPRGRAALGYTMQLAEQERFLRTKQDLLDRLAVTMGGRAAEELVFEDVSTGAHDDLRTATEIARQMVCMFGMSDRLGLPQCARPTESMYLGSDGSMARDCSEETSRVIDEEIRAMLDGARNRARAVLEAERPLLERITATLLEKETLDRASFEELVGSSPPPPSAPE